MDRKLPSLYQKADRKFYFTYRGKQYYAGSTREAATQKLFEVVGTGNSDGPHSIKDAVKEYLDSIEGVQSPDSVVTKRRTYNRVFEALPEIKSLFDLNSQVLETYRGKLLKSLKKQTINSVFHQLSAFLQYFVEKGVLALNPVQKLGKLKEYTDPVPDFLNEDERRQLIEFCERGRTPYVRQRDRLLFTLILNTGLRRIEVSHLKWSDIDLDKRVLVVRDGKVGKHRVIAINDTLYEMLRNFPRRSDHVITTYDGKPITRRGLSDIAEKYVDRLNHHYQGRKRFTLHSLRSTFATTLCEKGVSTRVVQSLLGHSDPRTTMRYAGVSEAALVDAVGRLV
jgi:site-specific recombinase XerD